MIVSIRGLLWILATYFVLALVALLASMVDLPPAFYMFTVLILPLVWLGRALEPVLSMFGLWSMAGPGGWISYAGPSFGGLLLIAIAGLAVSALLLRRAYHRGN
jgi:hypothetical protein